MATGDFDGDGRLEIVASNWGLNSAYRASASIRANFISTISTALAGSTWSKRVSIRPSARKCPNAISWLCAPAIPSLQARVPDFSTYGKMSVQEIYGDALAKAPVLEAKTFASMIFSPAGNKFIAKPLPTEAQLAPALAVCVADLDGDGNEDLFLSQNFFAVAPNEPRCDAGRGLMLKGNGHGELSAVPGQESGFKSMVNNAAPLCAILIATAAWMSPSRKTPAPPNFSATPTRAPDSEFVSKARRK